MKQKTIAILGATGSIGTQALDLVRRYPDRFSAACLTANSSSEKLFALVREFRPQAAGMVCEPEAIPEDLCFCQWFFGPDCSVEVLKAVKPDAALCAITGIAGLDAVWTALDVCSQVLLANKEALVTGGDLVMEKARRLNKPLLPVDSEHSAIFQCLQAAQGNPVRSLMLTASGGALRDWPKEKIDSARVEDVLRHPTWNMGRKITVDCASMVNKGLEIIEAHHLFHMPVEQIQVVVHPQSIIHSMVEFEDGAVLAQLGNPDMRGPIGYAMAYPERLSYEAKRLSFAEIANLSFAAPDLTRFPALGYAIEALKAGGAMPIVLNGANEEAVAAFLDGKIPFGRIPEILRDALDRVPQRSVNCIADVYQTDADARACAIESIRRNS
ncbi:MAG: 1-deoxy-D-xylulose-5-phosphate reductoisomerase [Aristaeellaceae bacterium]